MVPSTTHRRVSFDEATLPSCSTIRVARGQAQLAEHAEHHDGDDHDRDDHDHDHHPGFESSKDRDDSVKRQCFEHHRKQHYNMKEALKRARQLTDDDEEEDAHLHAHAHRSMHGDVDATQGGGGGDVGDEKRGANGITSMMS